MESPTLVTRMATGSLSPVRADPIAFVNFFESGDEADAIRPVSRRRALAGQKRA
jgi:hypothetical protein